MSWNQIDSRTRWTAEDEIAFLQILSNRRPEACLAYCALILDSRRVWDSTVDVGRVKGFARQMVEGRMAA